MKKYLLLILFLTAGAAMAANPRKSADALIRRVAQGGARNIETRIEPAEKDFFEIAPKGERVVITANTAVNAAVGFNWYLKYVAHIHLSWNNLTMRLPDLMPVPAEKIRQDSDLKLRYYLNFCTFSYSMPFWDWSRWQQEIDWMAMHGINMPLDIVGNEAVWRSVLTKLGYDETGVNNFIAGPAFGAWWQMNNLQGWGGSNPAAWYDRQRMLGVQIVHRMRELGISPVFPGFSGMVPSDIAGKLGWEVADSGKWCGFQRPGFLSPDDPHFDEMAKLYYDELERLYGKTEYYAMDPFHEGAKAEGVDIAAAGQKILKAMKRANPNATWVLQGWQHNPLPEMTRALPKGEVLVLDLQSDKRPKWGDKRSEWYSENGYEGHDWIFCMLENFGGRMGLYGDMEFMVDGFYQARKQSGRGMVGEGMSGVGATPEAIENNPVMFELLFELPWRETQFSPREWLNGYLVSRYGGAVSTEISRAWDILYKTSYNTPRTWGTDGAVECLVGARPGLHLKRVSTWGSAEAYYDPALMEQAADLMWQARSPFWRVNTEIDMETLNSMKGKGHKWAAYEAARTAAASNNFIYDMIDIKRQALADHANVLVEEFSEAHDRGDMNTFSLLSERFLDLIDEMDTLLGARPEFRLDTWTGAARAALPAHADWLEWNARTLITTWGGREQANAGGLHDYSYRQWAGLMGLYRQRWARFFEAELAQRGSGSRIDWYPIEAAWSSSISVRSEEPRVELPAASSKKGIFGRKKK